MTLFFLSSAHRGKLSSLLPPNWHQHKNKQNSLHFYFLLKPQTYVGGSHKSCSYLGLISAPQSTPLRLSSIIQKVVAVLRLGNSINEILIHNRNNIQPWLTIESISHSWKLVVQLCLTLCNPMDGSLLGSSVHGLLQARILEWVVIPFSRGSSQPRDQTRVSCIAGRFFTTWATRETPWFVIRCDIIGEDRKGRKEKEVNGCGKASLQLEGQNAALFCFFFSMRKVYFTQLLLWYH